MLLWTGFLEICTGQILDWIVSKCLTWMERTGKRLFDTDLANPRGLAVDAPNG